MKPFGMLLLALALSTFARSEDLASGTWSKKAHTIHGRWRITLEGDGSRVLRLSGGFKTRKAPDLKLVLSPLPLAELNNRNAMQGAVVISPLASNKGAQTYVLPSSADLAEIQSLVIHCERYSKLWGGAALDAP